MKTLKGRTRGLAHEQCSRPARASSGFTLVEVMFASSLGLLLFLVLFETLLFCRRSAANLRWQLTADALAFDAAWDVLNRKTEWFDLNATPTAFPAGWQAVPPDRSSAFLRTGTPAYYLEVQPMGRPVTHWQIIANVQWPLPNGGARRLAQPYILERHRADRNLFRSGL